MIYNERNDNRIAKMSCSDYYDAGMDQLAEMREEERMQKYQEEYYNDMQRYLDENGDDYDASDTNTYVGDDDAETTFTDQIHKYILQMCMYMFCCVC
jgi:hypothetical protein